MERKADKRGSGRFSVGKFDIGAVGRVIAGMFNIRKLLQVVVTVLALIALVFVSALVTLKVLTWGETVTVPDVRRMELARAINVLKEEGLEASVEIQEHHPVVPENAIIHQSPPPGSKVKTGRGVSLIVSLGSEEVTSPVLVGEVFNRAHILISRANLTLGDVSRVSSSLPRDQVISQMPPADETLQKGEKVALLVSDGPEAARFLTPELVGLSLTDAEKLTGHMSVRLIQSGRGPAIVSQSPKPGYAIPAGGALYITLGSLEPVRPPVIVN